MQTSLTVMVIDDDLGDRKLIRRTLRTFDFVQTIHECDSLPVALDLQVETAPDFVFVDYGLPGTDGISAIGRIHERWPASAVALITGQGDEIVAAEAIKSGAVDYLPKRHLSENAISRVITNGVQMARLRNRLQEHRRELEDFAHNLAHDLKAPIVSMGYLGNFILEDLEAGAVEDAARNVTDLISLAQRLSNAIDDLSNYLQLDQTAVHQTEEACALVEAALANLFREISARKAQVHVADLPVIHCASSEIILLFQNLVENALKYCPDERPQVRITAERESHASWLFTVSDNGMGVPEEAAERIFRPFQRLHPGSEIPGSGLGLATCAKIVKRHGGHIWCEPEKTGSRFCFSLPASDRRD